MRPTGSTATLNKLIPLLYEELRAQTEDYLTLRAELDAVVLAVKFQKGLVQNYRAFFVSQGLELPALLAAVDPHVPPRESGPRATENLPSSLAIAPAPQEEQP